jgi:hypothetical protein
MVVMRKTWGLVLAVFVSVLVGLPLWALAENQQVVVTMGGTINPLGSGPTAAVQVSPSHIDLTSVAGQTVMADLCFNNLGEDPVRVTWDNGAVELTGLTALGGMVDTAEGFRPSDPACAENCLLKFEWSHKHPGDTYSHSHILQYNSATDDMFYLNLMEYRFVSSAGRWDRGNINGEWFIADVGPSETAHLYVSFVSSPFLSTQKEVSGSILFTIETQ